MAIKVNGCTIIDDSRNIVNAASFTFNDGTCQTTASKNPYMTGIACSNISAGDPVSLICGCKGLATTVGCVTPTTMLYAPMTCEVTETAVLKFTDTCFASIQITAPCSYSTTACVCISCNCCVNCSFSGCVPGAICVRTHKLSSTGSLSSACLCCTSYSYTCVGRSWSIPGCSGTTGAIVTPISNNCLMETFFCYCTTNCTISMVRQCCACIASPFTTSFVTPDGNYFVSFVVCSPWTSNYGSLYCQAGWPCACWCIGAVVKRTSDTACYLDFTLATSCTVPLNSVLPATCATWHAGPSRVCDSYACTICCQYGGGFYFWNGSYCQYCYIPGTSYYCVCSMQQQGGVGAASRGFTPFSYGTDGWILMNYYVCAIGSTANVCAAAGSSPTICWIDKYFAFKPIGDSCYALTCNSIVPDIAQSSNTMMYYASQCCKSSCLCLSADFSYTYDTGNGIKRQLITSNMPALHCYTTCYPYGYNSYSGVLMTGSSGMTSCSNPGPTYMQCFCVNAGACIVNLGVNTVSLSSSRIFEPCLVVYTCGWYGSCGASATVHPFNISCFSMLGGMYGQTICGGSGVSPFTSGKSTYLHALYKAAIPVCLQCGCYYFAADSVEVYGCDGNLGAGAMVRVSSDAILYSSCNNCYYCYCTQCCMPNSVYTAVKGQFGDTLFCVCCCFCQLTCAAAAYNAQPLTYAGGYSPNSAISCSTNNLVTFTNLAGINNCRPVLWGKNSLGVTCLAAASPVTATTDKWIGIAQNTATAGQVVCYATPGMTDRSSFAATVASSYPCGATVGWYPGNGVTQGLYSCWLYNSQTCSYYLGTGSAYTLLCCCQYGTFMTITGYNCNCCCLGMQTCTNGAAVMWSGTSNPTPCVANTTLLNGINCDSNNSFKYYNDNIRFVPFYDASTCSWAAQILTHCKNFYSTDCCGTLYFG